MPVKRISCNTCALWDRTNLVGILKDFGYCLKGRRLTTGASTCRYWKDYEKGEEGGAKDENK